MKSKSLTKRAALVSLTAQMFCALILCTAALLHEMHTRYRALDAQIQGRSDSLLGAVQDAEDPDANVTIDASELKIHPRDIFAVYNQGGRLLGASQNAPPALIARSTPGFRDVRLPHEKYRVLQRDALRVIDRAEYRGVGLRRPVTIIFALPEDHERHEVFEAASFYVTTILLVTGSIAFLLPMLLRRTMRPLADLADSTASIHGPEFAFEPPASAVELSELRPLTEVLRTSMARVRASFTREQQFVSDAAHELKTAVAVARSSVQLLLLKPRSEQDYRLGLERVVDDVDRLESLIAQMLQLARVEEGPTHDTPVVDLGETLTVVVALLDPIARQKGLAIEAEVSPGLCVRLRQQSAESLLSNLLLNALQHSAVASPPVHVSIRRVTSGEIALKVQDHGTGITPEALPHIFERFYREDKSRSRETGGTGLGLAIAKSIVEAGHGNIQVESTPGVGTTMLVIFMPA